MADAIHILTRRLGPAFATVAGPCVPAPSGVRRSDHADYQADGALALARRLQRNPRDIASDIVEAAELDDLCENIEISGPGFVNLTLRASPLAAQDTRTGTVVVDYSAPNDKFETGEAFKKLSRRRVVVEELDTLGLLETRDDARCVFPPGFTNRQGEPLPVIAAVAAAVGIGAINYTALCLQYAHTRIPSIFRRAGETVQLAFVPRLAEPAERRLALRLLGLLGLLGIGAPGRM